MLSWWFSGKESACQCRTGVGSLGQEDPLEQGNGNPLWDTCLRNFMDRGACQATVLGVTEESDMT